MRDRLRRLVDDAVERAPVAESQLRRFGKYVAVGLVGLLINEGTLYLVTGVAGLSYVLGGFLGRATSIVVNFALNDSWTWRGRGAAGVWNWLGRCLKYVGTRVVGVGIGLGALVLFVELADMHYLVANLFAIGVGILWGFAASELWVWRDASKPPLRSRLPDWVAPWRTVDVVPAVRRRLPGVDAPGDRHERPVPDDGRPVSDDGRPVPNGGASGREESAAGTWRPRLRDLAVRGASALGFATVSARADREPSDDGSGGDDTGGDGGTGDDGTSVDGPDAAGEDEATVDGEGPKFDGGQEEPPPGGDDRRASRADDWRATLGGSDGGFASAVATAAGGARHELRRARRVARTRVAAVDRGTWLVVALAAGLAVWFSWYTIQLYEAFVLTGADFGSYVHMFETTLQGEGFLQQGKYRVNHPGGVYWGAHFTLTLLLYLPVYALFPTPETLLVAKSVVVASSVVALWYVARAQLGRPYLAGVVVVSYAFNPFLWSAWSFDFQEQSLLPLFLFGAYYAYLKRRRYLFLGLALAALLTNEFLVPIMAGFVVALGVVAFREDDLRARLPTLVAAFGLVVFAHLLSGLVIDAFSRHGGIPVRVVAIPLQEYVYQGDPRVSMVQVAAAAAAHPNVAVNSLLTNFDRKLLYLLALMLPVGLLSLSDELTLGPLAPFLGFAWVLGRKSAYWTFSAHYPLYFLPFVYIGLVHTLDRFPVPSLSREGLGRLLVYAVLLNVVTVSLVGPLNLEPVPQPNEHHETVEDAIDTVPEDASLLVQNNVFPHAAAHPDAKFVVARYDVERWEELYGPLTPEYVIYDVKSHRFWSSLVVEVMGDRLGTEYGIFRYEDGVWVFKRGYRGDPQAITTDSEPSWFDGASRQYDVEEFSVQNGEVVDGTIVGESAGIVWFGPYETVPAGTYTATFRVKVDGSGGPAGNVHVAAGIQHEVVARKALTPKDGWQTVELTFSFDRPQAKVEFRGAHAGGDGRIVLDSVELVARGPPENPAATGSPGRFSRDAFDPDRDGAPGDDTDRSVGGDAPAETPSPSPAPTPTVTPSSTATPTPTAPAPTPTPGPTETDVPTPSAGPVATPTDAPASASGATGGADATRSSADTGTVAGPLAQVLRLVERELAPVAAALALSGVRRR